MYLLGYDLGSSSIKAGLVEAATGKQVGLVSYPEQEMEMSAPKSGWAEQEPEHWWENLVIATQRLLSKTGAKAEDIQAIGISYQMHGLVMVDKAQQVLRSAIIWCDSRAVTIGDKAFEEMGHEQCLSHLLNSPGNFTAAKLKWVKENEPEIYDRIHKIMLPGDYMAMRLTGEINTTISGLSEGIFWDFKKHQVSHELMDCFGFDPSLLPEQVDTIGIQGQLSHSAAEVLGLPKDTPVTYRAGDQPNNALSLNVLKPGELAATAGTSGVVYGVVDQPVFDLQSRVNAFAHVNHSSEAARIGILLCINGAGSQYAWVRKQIAPMGTSYEDMEKEAASIPIGCDGLSLLPFGNGAERMLVNQNIGCHWTGLEFNRHGRAHLYRAALEGIAFSFVYGVNIMKEMGIEAQVLRVGNDNLFQSVIFAQTIASLLHCRIEVIDTTGAYGAARAAGVALGEYQNIEEAMGSMDVEYVIDPHPSSALDEAYAQWLIKLNTLIKDQ